MTPFFYIIPGIFDGLENPATWDYQAQLWLFRRACGLAAGFNYRASILGGIMARERMAMIVADDLVRAKDTTQLRPIKVAAHSNGTNIVLQALAMRPEAVADELHLIASAADRDCNQNHLNLITQRGQVGKVVLYVSADDEVLGLPKLGYGDLGKAGPTNLCTQLAGILTRVDQNCGHSDWITTNFESTMQRIAGKDAA